MNNDDYNTDILLYGHNGLWLTCGEMLQWRKNIETVIGEQEAYNNDMLLTIIQPHLRSNRDGLQ